MQAVTILIFDGVLLVIEDAAQTFVKMRNVISAVEIIVDVDFPIARDVVGSALEKMKIGL